MERNGRGLREQGRRMVVAIAGGALQGLEIAYLAAKASFETVLLDRRNDAPATAISSSKSESDSLFRKLGLPIPAPWPDCSFPVVAKPDGGSGSRGVEVFPHRQALEARFGLLPPPGRVLQEYLIGPFYSIEVMGRPGNYHGLQITSLEMDRRHDCKRVLAPSSLPPHLAGSFEETAVTLAEAVGLTGIMDVEAVLHEGQLKLLEMDARFPSQTPVAVYHSTGINMVECLAMIFSPRGWNELDSIRTAPAQGSILEHIRVSQGELTVCGEHIMTEAGPLHVEASLFGAEEALTNYVPGRGDWVATLMVKGKDLEDVRNRRDQVISEIQDRCGLTSYRDESPQVRAPNR